MTSTPVTAGLLGRGAGGPERTAGLDRRLVADRVAALLETPPAGRSPSPDPAGGGARVPVPFVCEDDVRVAIRESRPIVIGERTIVTPAARDLAQAHGVFVER